MSKQVLSIGQMQHLEKLGVDTSKASGAQTDVWVSSDLDEFQKAEDVLVFTESESDYFEFENPIKKFTLQDILDLLPKVITKNEHCYYFEMCRNENKYYVTYYWLDNPLVEYENEEFIDAAYKMLCWCIVNGYIKTDNQYGKEKA